MINNEMTKKKVFVETYGCPYLPVLHDDSEDFKEDKRFIINRLYKIGYKKLLQENKRGTHYTNI